MPRLGIRATAAAVLGFLTLLLLTYVLSLSGDAEPRKYRIALEFLVPPEPKDTPSETAFASEHNAVASAVAVESEFAVQPKTALETAPLETTDPVTSYRLLGFPELLSEEDVSCQSCHDAVCAIQCDQLQLVLTELHQNALNDDTARLTIVPVDAFAWIKDSDDAKRYRYKLTKLVKTVHATYEYPRFKGSDFVFLCLSHSCPAFARDLSMALSGAHGTRAIYAGAVENAETLEWPCPLRIIDLHDFNLQDARRVATTLVQRATHLIEKRHRWICADATHPATHWPRATATEVLNGAYMPQYGFSICAIPKCGSTMTISLLRRMTGKKDWNKTGNGQNHGPKAGIKFMAHVDPQERQVASMNLSFVSAVVVRHPASRLLSGFLDKIHDKGQYHRLPGVKACLKGVKLPPSFPQFVDCLIKTHPSPNKLDGHFRAQSTDCDMRHSQPDFVGKLSNLGKEMKEFGESLGFWEEYGASGWSEDGTHSFAEKSFQHRTHDSHSVIWDHYTEELLQKVYKYYKEDFDRFGFTVEELLAVKPAA